MMLLMAWPQFFRQNVICFATYESSIYISLQCELDIMFNLEKAHFILDEMICNGHIIETNKVSRQIIVATQEIGVDITFYLFFFLLHISPTSYGPRSSWISIRRRNERMMKNLVLQH